MKLLRMYIQNEMSDIWNVFIVPTYLLDNNTIKQVNRCISLIQHSSLFFGSHTRANRAAIYYSLACSCCQRRMFFFEYISDIMTSTATLSLTVSVEVYRELLWKHLLKMDEKKKKAQGEYLERTRGVHR